MSPSDDTALRHQLSRMLGGGRAFAEPERILRDIPQHARGVIVKGIGRSIWQVLEHIRIDQQDLIDRCLTAEYDGQRADGELWPDAAEPSGEPQWRASVDALLAGISTARRIALDQSINLFSVIPHGTTETWLAVLVVIAEHNAYHFGQIAAMRKVLGIW